MRTILKSTVLTILLGAASACAENTQEVLLRFSPETGHTYRYSYSVNLDKTTMGRTSNERLEASFLVSVLRREKKEYQTRWDTVIVRGNLIPQVMDQIEDKVAESREFAVSERYVFTPDEGQSLFFPRKPVKIGAAWEGTPLFRMGDLATAEPPLIKVEYRLVRINQKPHARVATIECTPIENSVTVPLQIGQLGIRCDENGRIVELGKDTEAEKKLKVGDILVAINGHECTISKSRSLLVQRFVEVPNDNRAEVSLTIQRGDERIDTNLPKFTNTWGEMRVEFVKSQRTVDFDLDKGIMISDLATARFSVTYHFKHDIGFVDDYLGRDSIKRLTRSNMPPRIYDYEWKTAFVGEGAAHSRATAARDDGTIEKISQPAHAAD